MTDNEIIMTMRYFSSLKVVVNQHTGQVLTLQDILDLINRQKAEIERLEKEVVDRDKIIDERGNEVIRHDNAIRSLYKQLETIRAKAIKEFAERLKEKLHLNDMVIGSNCAIVEDFAIDNLVKEMTEGKDAGKDI